MMQAPLDIRRQPQGSAALAAARRRNEALFTRWLLMVYIPLGLLAAGFILFLFGIMPGSAMPVLLALAAWGLFAIRLLWERRKRGLEVPPPRSMVVGIGLVAGVALIGAILTWIGLDRLASTSGVAMVYAGGVLMLTALFAPAFKVLDIAIRGVARRVLREHPAHEGRSAP